MHYCTSCFLKLPRCEIFDFLYSRDSFTIEPLWVDDMGTDLKNSKFKRLGHVFDFYVLKIVF